MLMLKLDFQVGRHEFRHIHTSGGSSHLGDRHATYNLFNFGAPTNRPSESGMNASFGELYAERYEMTSELTDCAMQKSNSRNTCW